MEKINVLIVDDSAIVRELLSKKLGRHPGINVVGTAPDPYVARDKIEKGNVDVLTLDIEMPRMDGLTFLKYLMKYEPIPVIVVSSLTDGANRASIEALELGAVDIVPKPGGPFSVEEVIDILTTKILAIRNVDRKKLHDHSDRLKSKTSGEKKAKYLSTIATTKKIIAIGASTGGTVALETVFMGFDVDFPPTLAVIHMPEKFTASFARRLDDLCRVTVKEACDGDRIMPATVYIAPGGYHMILKAVGTEKHIRIVTGPKVHNQRPAVDVLFSSVAENAGKNSIGILLTGMGKDGAKGLLSIRDSGGYTIAQDEETSIVFGMPKEAIALGAANAVLPLGDIANHIREVDSVR